MSAMDMGLDYTEPVSDFENPRISSWAKASLVLGLVSVGTILATIVAFISISKMPSDGVSVGFTGIPLVFGVLAVVAARIAKKRILMTDLEGDSVANAGQALGVIGLVIVAFVVIYVLMQERLGAFSEEFFHWETIKKSWPSVGRGFLTTLKLAVVSEVFILITGLAVAMLRISRFKTLRFLAAAYIDIIRGLPLILQLFIIYFGLWYLGLNFTMFTAGVVALTVCYAAYEAEIFRAGIESVHKGQMEASRSLGMTYFQSMRYVVLPQAVRRVIPPLSNEFIMLTKDTALIAFIGMGEAFLKGKEAMGRFANVTPLVGVAVFFLIITLPAMHGVRYLEKRLSRSD